MAGINNLNPVSFDRTVFEQFKSIAQDDAVGNNAVLQVAGKSVATGGDFIGNIARFKETQERNNVARTAFLDAVKGLYGVKDVKALPPTVRDALQLHNFNVDKNDRATTGRPLSARRVRAVLRAIEDEQGLASFKMLDGEARNRELARDLQSMLLTFARNATVSVLGATFNDKIDELSDKIAAHLTATIQTIESPRPGELKKMRKPEVLQELMRATMCRLLDSKSIFFNRDFLKGVLPSGVKQGCAACLLALAKARARVRKDVLWEKDVKPFEKRVKIFDVSTSDEIVEDKDPEFMKVVDGLVSRLVKLRDHLGANYQDGSEQGRELERILDDLEKSVVKEAVQDAAAAAPKDGPEKEAQKLEREQMQAALEAANKKCGDGVAKARAELLDLAAEDLEFDLSLDALSLSQKTTGLVRAAIDALPPAQKKANASWMSALSQPLVCSQLKEIVQFASDDASDAGAVKGVACLLVLKHALLAADPAIAQHRKSALELNQRIMGTKGSTACCQPRYQAVAKEQMALLKNLNLNDGKAAMAFLDNLWAAMDEQTLNL